MGQELPTHTLGLFIEALAEVLGNKWAEGAYLFSFLWDEEITALRII